MTKNRKKVYFAGPDVFELNAIKIGKDYVKKAKERNLIGMFPLDNKVELHKDDADKVIFNLNKSLLDMADYVVANLNSFRGHEPDSGTVWEIAYAFAKGKPVIGYINNDDTMIEKISKTDTVSIEEGIVLDKDKKIIENFNNQLNLMIQNSLTYLVIGGAKEALDKVKDIETNIKVKPKS